MSFPRKPEMTFKTLKVQKKNFRKNLWNQSRMFRGNLTLNLYNSDTNLGLLPGCKLNFTDFFFRLSVNICSVFLQSFISIALKLWIFLLLANFWMCAPFYYSDFICFKAFKGLISCFMGQKFLECLRLRQEQSYVFCKVLKYLLK